MNMNMEKKKKDDYKLGQVKDQSMLNRNDFNIFNRHFSHTTRKMRTMVSSNTTLSHYKHTWKLKSLAEDYFLLSNKY